MEKRYWVVSPNVKNNSEVDDWKNFLSSNPYSCMGWDDDNPKGNTFIHTISVGDIIINAQRKDWKTTIYGIGKVVDSSCPNGQLTGMPSECYYRKLYPYITNTVIKYLKLEFYGATNNGDNYQIPAIYELHPDRNTKDKEIVEVIMTQLNIVENIQKPYDFLIAKHNIILHGAPGTGKTYTARQIAAKMMFDKAYENLTEDEKSNIGFVQFHPSYDYTDFVEGLRPIKGDGEKDIGFERKNGVFKDFCEKAIKARSEAGVDNFEKSWQELIDKLNNDIRIEIPLVSGKGTFEVELNEYGDGLSTRTYNTEEDKEAGNWVRGQSKFFSKEQLYNIYKGLNGIPSGGHDNYRKAVVAEMKKTFHLEDYKEGKAKDEAPKFVFIIDEINRGDISKIFGELFFSVDPDYRGTKGKILTQYQNLIKDDDTFKNGFYIPDNVYIIGTMNDIDRSVESMDFAMRRRFVFYEITAEASANAIGIDYSVNSPMKKLNDAIEEKLGTDYQIGGSYFQCYKDKLNDQTALKELWENSLKGLLREYLRGQRDAKTTLDEFESVFNETNTNNGQQQQNS